MGWQDREYGSEEGYYQMAGRRWGARPGRLSLTGTLVVVNVAVFVLAALIRDRETDPLMAAGEMSTPLVLGGQIWRLVTSQYLHIGVMHLFFNMLGLYFLGNYLEQHWGRRKFFLFYTICGMAGNLFYMVLNIIGWLAPWPAVGASGCIFGVVGACAVLFPGIRLIVYIFPMKIRTFAVLFAGLYALNLLDRGYNAGGDAAHLAGIAFGAGYAYWTRRPHGQARGFSPVRVARVVVQPPPPAAWTPPVVPDDELEREVDRILAKIREQGLTSLTDTEKRTLAQASSRK